MTKSGYFYNLAIVSFSTIVMVVFLLVHQIFYKNKEIKLILPLISSFVITFIAYYLTGGLVGIVLLVPAGITTIFLSCIIGLIWGLRRFFKAKRYVFACLWLIFFLPSLTIICSYLLDRLKCAQRGSWDFISPL